MSINRTPKTWGSEELVSGDLNAEIKDLWDGLQDGWTSYTPTWTGSVSHPAIGDGTLEGAYHRVGKTIHLRIRIVTGSSTTYGSGTFSLSLPVAGFGGYSPNLLAVYAVGGNYYYGATYGASGTAFGLAVNTGAAGGALAAVSPTVPATFASGALITVSGTYEAA